MGSRSDTADDVVAPKNLIVPVCTALASSTTIPEGFLMISGAKLYFWSTSWRLVTST